MEDISILLGSEIEINNKDVSVISDNNELIQNIKIEALTMEGDVWYNLEFGWSLYEFLHRPIDEMLKLEIKQRIITKLSRRDEIEKSSIEIDISNIDDGLLIKINFMILGQSVDLTLSLDRLNIEVL